MLQELIGRVRVERAERQRLCSGIAPRPVGPLLEQVRPREAQDQQRDALNPAREVLDGSRNVGSAQCTSSKQTTSGRSRASASSRLRTCEKISSLVPPSGASGRISRTGQNVIPSPYGRQRPTRTPASPATPSRSSRASRDLPIPGWPSTVKSCGWLRLDSSRVRAVKLPQLRCPSDQRCVGSTRERVGRQVDVHEPPHRQRVSFPFRRKRRRSRGRDGVLDDLRRCFTE